MLDIPIIFEDESTLVINKPIGLVVTPGAGYEESVTLVGWLLNRYGEQLREVGSGVHRPGIVHRLDKDTSGVMVVAKTQMAFELLVDQFKKKTVNKEYVALVWGNIGERLKLNKWEAGYQFVVDAPIGRNPKNRAKFAVLEDGKPAKTKFVTRSLGVLGEIPVTLMDCFPETGRTHQIRIHLKSLGYSIVGDRLYQRRSEIIRFDEISAKEKLHDRMYLHARKLSIKMPVSELNQAFEAQLPPEFMCYPIKYGRDTS